MILRSAVFALLAGVAALCGPAVAQSYPPYEPPTVTRAPLPPMTDDGIDVPGEDVGPVPPAPYRPRPPMATPYDPQAPRYGHVMPDEEDLPTSAVPDVPPAPGVVQPHPSGYEPVPVERGPYPPPDPAVVPGRAAATPTDGPADVRPPADIAAPPSPQQTYSALPPEDQPETEAKELPPQFKRQLVDYSTREPAGTIIIDTPNTYLYLVMGNGKALRYGIGVGREGFTWSGSERISRMSEWPDWHPPAEMIERQPYLPRFMAGGPGNPLGARALYLGNTLYRIHGTNQPSTIGQFVSSGCIRLVNDDIEDLYSRVTIGTRVVVLPGGKPAPTASAAPVAPVTPVR